MVFVSRIALLPEGMAQISAIDSVDIALPQSVWHRSTDIQIASYDITGRRIGMYSTDDGLVVESGVDGWRTRRVEIEPAQGQICAVALVDVARALAPLCFYGIGPQTMSLVGAFGPAAALSPTVLDLPKNGREICFDYWGNRLDQSRYAALVGMCLTAGTAVRTPMGDRPIEDIQPGEMVSTWRGEDKPVRMVVNKVLTPSVRESDRHLWPVTLHAGSMGFGLPRREMNVSADQRMLYQHILVPLMFGEDAVFVRAKSLAASFEQVKVKTDPDETSYYQMVFDQHEIIFAKGAPTGSFMLNADSISALSGAERDRLFMLFPSLRYGGQSHDAAYMTLRSWELQTCVA